MTGLRPKPLGPEAEVAALRAELQAARDERDTAVKALPVEGWDEFMAERDAIATEQDRYGLPREAGVKGLLRHIYNNRDAALGALNLTCDGWQERATTAEAALQAAQEALRAAADVLGWVIGYEFPADVPLPAFWHALSVVRAALSADAPVARAVLVEGARESLSGDATGVVVANEETPGKDASE